jgi:hypothetical protein
MTVIAAPHNTNSAIPRNFGRALRCGAGTLLLALAGGAANAADPLPTAWTCWFGTGTSVACRLSDSMGDEPSGGTSAGETDVALAPLTPRGTLPPLVSKILDRPAALAGRQISIPLLGEPQDKEFVRELAESVMCGAKKLCSVRFLGSATELALFADEFEDPALN